MAAAAAPVAKPAARTLLSLTSRPLALSLPSVYISSSISPFKPLTLSHPRGRGRGFCRPLAAVARKVDVDSEAPVTDAEEGFDSEFSPDLRLYVGNLPYSVDSSQLAGLFGQAGSVEMVEVIYDKMTGRSRGFGFVTMSTLEEAEAACQQFNNYNLEGRPLRVNSGPPPPKDDSNKPFRGAGAGPGHFDASNRVYVGNLSWGVDNSALQTLFSEQGRVLDAKVVYDWESGRSRGFGFVTYSSAEEVNNAISRLDGADLNGRPIRVTVAEAKPRRQF